MEVFEEVLQHLLKFPTLWENIALYNWMMRTPHRQSGLNGTWIVSKFIFLSFFQICCFGFLFIFPNCHLLYFCRGFPSLAPMGLICFSTEDLQLNPSWNFLLPSYVEVEAQVMASMISPPNIKKHVKYDPSIRSLVDGEAIK